MPELASSDAAARIAEIDQELAVLTSGSGARAAVDATRQDLTFWKDFLGTTAKELGEAKDEIESTIEELGGRSLPTPGQPSVDDLIDAVGGLGGGDSAIGHAIESGIETIEGIRTDFEGAGDVTPESLGAVIGEFKESYQESVSQLLGGADDSTGAFKDILEHDNVKDAIERVAGAVEDGQKVFKGISEGVGKIDTLLETIQNIDDLSSADAQAQLEALAELLEAFTDKFGDVLSGIPGLGAFFTIYAKAFRGAAHSAGVIQGIADRNNRLYQIDREGRYLWITDAALRAIRIRDLKAERATIFDAGLAAARQERLDREEADLQTTATDRDIAVETAIRTSAGAQPALNSPAYRAWVQSSSDFGEAQSELESARVNLDMAHQELDEAQITAGRTDGGTDAATNAARVGMAESAVERAEQRLETANTNFDATQQTHAGNTAAHRAEVDTYNDAVRRNVMRNAAKTNSGRGFSESDWFWFNTTYPQWRVLGTDIAPVIPSSQLDPGAAATGVGATVAATSSSTTWRRVAIGGGGVLAAAMVLAVVFWISNTGEVSTTPPPTESPVVQQAEDVTTPTPAESVPTDPPVSDVSESKATVNDDPVPADSGDTSEVVIPDSGQDPRAQITSVTPVTLADGTQGLVATFAQSWGAMPPGDLFSFFVAFDVSMGSDSVMTGYEVHNGSTTPLGTIPMYILQDGSVVFGTGLPAGGSAGVTVSAQTGSWIDETTTQAVFANFSFDVAGGGPPFDMGLVVYDLLNQQSV